MKKVEINCGYIKRNWCKKEFDFFNCDKCPLDKGKRYIFSLDKKGQICNILWSNRGKEQDSEKNFLISKSLYEKLMTVILEYKLKNK